MRENKLITDLVFFWLNFYGKMSLNIQKERNIFYNSNFKINLLANDKISINYFKFRLFLKPIPKDLAKASFAANLFAK